MNRQEASLYFRLRVVPYLPVSPNKAMQTDGRFATAADRQGVRRIRSTTPASGASRFRPRDLLVRPSGAKQSSSASTKIKGSHARSQRVPPP